MLPSTLDLVENPWLLLVTSYFAMWLAAMFGRSILRRKFDFEGEREYYSIILAAALTLLALTIGFTLSMATSRYDQRKNYEEAEANAIGTEYLRADLVPTADCKSIRILLRQYLDARLQFYLSSDESEIRDSKKRTSALQNQLWRAVLSPALARPDYVTALAVSGMNDVINSEGYTQSSWWYRIPIPAWILMGVIALACNLLVGYGLRGLRKEGRLLLILPVIISIAFFLIADIDSPRHGIIRVQPQNLVSLYESLGQQ